MKQIILQANYNYSPLRSSDFQDFFISPLKIGISQNLNEQLFKWKNKYVEIINWENPRNGYVQNSPYRKFFIDEGSHLKKELIKEIGNHFIIKYYPIVSVRTFKLMADYDSLLLRDIEYPFSIEFNKLPISENLIKRLENWDVAYVATLNQEYPPLSDFPTPEERKKFMEEGYALHRLLQEALKDNFVIEYEPLPEKEDV